MIGIEEENPNPEQAKAQIIAPNEHHIDRSEISQPVLEVLHHLHQSGYQAYLVGGSVRDLCLGREPKDFDVVTDARPEQIKALFKRCRLIGRRFRLAHIYFGRYEFVEVATFRGLNIHHCSAQGMVLRDNHYGRIDEDAQRRDFSINALYYDVNSLNLLDYVNAWSDLKQGVLRLLGDPEQRYREDPVRMLRAIRFAVKLGFQLDPETAKPIKKMARLLGQVHPARLYGEVLKLFFEGHAVSTAAKLKEYRLFKQLFPYDIESNPLLLNSLKQMDHRFANHLSLSPPFFFACLLWPMVNHSLDPLYIHSVLMKQSKHTAIPRRVGYAIKVIWSLQKSLEKLANKKKGCSLLTHPHFRAAYDFLLLRAKSGESNQKIVRFWTQLQKKKKN